MLKFDLSKSCAESGVSRQNIHLFVIVDLYTTGPAQTNALLDLQIYTMPLSKTLSN